MYGSYASLEADAGTAFLFIEVDDVEAACAAVAGAPVVSPLHRRFMARRSSR
jgi:hypothetical protein